MAWILVRTPKVGDVTGLGEDSQAGTSESRARYLSSDDEVSRKRTRMC